MHDEKLAGYWRDREICLTDGTWIPLTAKQIQWLQEVIFYLPFQSFSTQKIKIDDRTFTLNDIEYDPQKIQQHKQNRLDF